MLLGSETTEMKPMSINSDLRAPHLVPFAPRLAFKLRRTGLLSSILHTVRSSRKAEVEALTIEAIVIVVYLNLLIGHAMINRCKSCVVWLPSGLRMDRAGYTFRRERSERKHSVAFHSNCEALS